MLNRKTKEFKCNYCNSYQLFIIDKGPHKGLYCVNCGHWIAWLNKYDLNACRSQFKRMSKKEG